MIASIVSYKVFSRKTNKYLWLRRVSANETEWSGACCKLDLSGFLVVISLIECNLYR